MRKFLFLFIVVIVSAASVHAAGKKDVKIEMREVGKFININIEGAAAVFYTQGNATTVKVKTTSDRMADVKTFVKGNTLTISVHESRNFFRWRSNASSPAEVYVTSPDLTGVQLLGSGDFVCNSKLDTDVLDIGLRGSGDVTFKDIICDNIRIILTGSGDIRLNNVDALTSSVVLVGSGDISIKQKNVKNTTIDLKGSGDISVAFTKCGSATSSLKGSGDITLSGTLKSLEKTSLGSGDYHTSHLSVSY